MYTREFEVRFLAGARDCSLLHNVHSGFGAQQAYYSMVTWGSFGGVTATGP
jgi:hypothetical protein